MVKKHQTQTLPLARQVVGMKSVNSHYNCSLVWERPFGHQATGVMLFKINFAKTL